MYFNGLAIVPTNILAFYHTLFISHTPFPFQGENYEAQLIELHKAKAGYTPAQAESEFLEIARKLPRYGMHLFSARASSHTFAELFRSCVNS